MARSYLIILVILMGLNSQAQKITYSKPESKDIGRFLFDAIARHGDKILVYKSVYPGSPSGISQYQGPNASVLESSIYIYDLKMNLVEMNLLPLPREISGIHFLAYGDFFYMFYQYRSGHTIYCMAARIGMDGKIMGKPQELDHMEVLDIHYQRQIYTVISSEDKRHIIAFTDYAPSGDKNTIRSLQFDQDLHLVRQSAHQLTMEGSEYLSEFKVDNEGNFVFLGLSESGASHNAHRGIIFTLGTKDDSLTYHYFVPSDLFIDDPRLTIDNNHKKYIVFSFYSLAREGNIRGLLCLIRDTGRGNDIAVTKTTLSDSIRRQIKGNGNTKKIFNDFYLQDLHLLQGGGFAVEAESLYYSDKVIADRWNYHQYLFSQVATNFVFYDPYEGNHYFPWNIYREAGFNANLISEKTMILSFKPDGIVEWVNVINSPQPDRLHPTPGYKSFAGSDLLYLLYNVNIRNRHYLTAQSISVSGQINTDPRLKEDGQIRDADGEYYYYTRSARVVGPGEIILLCQKRNMMSLARVEF